jgi:hypothetical protein
MYIFQNNLDSIIMYFDLLNCIKLYNLINYKLLIIFIAL